MPNARNTFTCLGRAIREETQEFQVFERLGRAYPPRLRSKGLGVRVPPGVLPSFTNRMDAAAPVPFDPAAYLARIGLASVPAPTADALAGLHERHAVAIPFE